LRLGFIHSQGRSIGDPTIFQLRGSASVALDFTGDANQRVGERISLRAAVTVSDPTEFPSCAAGVLTSVEIIDRLTHATHVILTNPALQQVQR